MFWTSVLPVNSGGPGGQDPPNTYLTGRKNHQFAKINPKKCYFYFLFYNYVITVLDEKSVVS